MEVRQALPAVRHSLAVQGDPGDREGHDGSGDGDELGGPVCPWRSTGARRRRPYARRCETHRASARGSSRHRQAPSPRAPADTVG